MIKLENLKRVDTLCAGATYVGKASFEGKTVREVLEEIKEYSKDKDGGDLGYGFGNPNEHWGWEIEINDHILLSNWIGHKPEFTYKYDDLKVISVEVDGGWYSYYNFHITTECYYVRAFNCNGKFLVNYNPFYTIEDIKKQLEDWVREERCEISSYKILDTYKKEISIPNLIVTRR